MDGKNPLDILAAIVAKPMTLEMAKKDLEAENLLVFALKVGAPTSVARCT